MSTRNYMEWYLSWSDIMQGLYSNQSWEHLESEQWCEQGLETFTEDPFLHLKTEHNRKTLRLPYNYSCPWILFRNSDTIRSFTWIFYPFCQGSFKTTLSTCHVWTMYRNIMKTSVCVCVPVRNDCSSPCFLIAVFIMLKDRDVTLLLFNMESGNTALMRAFQSRK